MTNKKNPTISVLMSVYNGEKHLYDSVSSILRQTYKNFEFIILDNASTDRSLEVINSFEDPRLHVIRNEKNLGQTRALNIGLRKAKGEFIARMDADDVSRDNRLEEQLKLFRSKKDAVVVGSWHDEIDSKGRYLKTMKYPTDSFSIRSNLISEGNLTKRCLAHPTVMMKRQAVLDVGGYSENIEVAQDYDLWLKLIQKGEIYNVPTVLLDYRFSKFSTSKKRESRMSEEVTLIIQKNVEQYSHSNGPSSVQNLVKMLRNERTDSSKLTLFNHFDRFFDKYMGYRPLKSGKGADYFKDMIKFYYLPKFFFQAPLRALLLFIRYFVKHPEFVLDDKFLKNCGKALLFR